MSALHRCIPPATALYMCTRSCDGKRLGLLPTYIHQTAKILFVENMRQSMPPQ